MASLVVAKTARGLIFRFDAETKAIVKLHDFGDDYNLVVPRLLEASDGNVYGLTEIGGQFVHGSFFKYDIESDEAEHIYEFQFGAPHIPDSYLIEAFNGRIYATTRYGGTGLGRGTIFEYDLASGSFRFVESLDDAFPLESAFTEVGEREVTSLRLSAASSTISSNRASLQINAAILPSSVASQRILWSVSDPSKATISQTGRLSARANGVVVVTAVANSGLGVSDEITIQISNQTEIENGASVVAPVYLLLEED